MKNAWKHNTAAAILAGICVAWSTAAPRHASQLASLLEIGGGKHTGYCQNSAPDCNDTNPPRCSDTYHSCGDDNPTPNGTCKDMLASNGQPMPQSCTAPGCGGGRTNQSCQQ